MDASPATAELRGLVVHLGEGAGTWQPVRSPVTLIGRALGCDIILAGQTVRLLHCVLAPDHDGIALRSIHTGGVKVNGRSAATAVLRDGDQFEVGSTVYRVRWPAVTPTHDSGVEALRIQTAALVAQQSAIFDREIRVQEREAALAQQEEQLANHLEDKRRQLLELQDQITVARQDLRDNRAALEKLAHQQEQEWIAARDQAAELLADAKAKHARIRSVQQRLRARRQRERLRLIEAEAKLVAGRQHLDSERAKWLDEVLQFNGRVELDQRQLQDGWQKLNEEREAWQARRRAELDDLHRRLRDLAARDKAIAAAESRQKAERARLDRELSERRHEIEHLETRIGHARQRLLESQSEVLVSLPNATWNAIVSDRQYPAKIDSDDTRLHTLAQVACELADQRLWLAEQIARLNQARERWLTERDQSAADLDALAAELQVKEQALDRRGRDLSASEQRIQTEARSMVHSQLQLIAERTRGEAELSARRRELETRAEEISARETRFKDQQRRLHEVLRRWGRRRQMEVEKLRTEIDGCRSERGEWAAARDSWLREYEQIVAERRDLATRSLALEQVRDEWLQSTNGKALARKRLERLERQWVTQFNVDIRDLDRLRDTIENEAGRLDELAERVRADRIAAVELLASTQEKAEQVEADRASFEAERMQIAETVELEQFQRAAAETHVLGLRDEVESLARLFIDAPAPISRAA